MRYLLLLTLLTLGFTQALAQDALSVTSLTLVNADTGEPVFDLTDGAVINFADLGTDKLSVVANTSPDPVGSVVFGFDDTPDYQVESLAPYTIAGDDTQGGAVSYGAWTPSVGEHTLTATPYSESGAGGTAGTPLSVRFSVTNDPQTATVPAPSPIPVETDTATDAATETAAEIEPNTEPNTATETATETTPTPEISPQTEAVVVTPAPTPAPAPAPATTPAPTPTPTTDSTSVTTQPAPSAEPTARLRQARFEVVSDAASTFGGTVLAANYGLDQAVLTILLNPVSPSESYTALLEEGGCNGRVDETTSLESVDGRTGLSANAVDLTYDALLDGNHYLGLYESATGQGSAVSCTLLNR